MTKRRFIQDRVTGKLVEAALYHRPEPDAPTVLAALEPFTSPISGELITDRGQLRRHNKRHGVTDTRDYGESYFGRRSKEMNAERTGQTPAAKQERIETIKHAIEQQRR